MTVNMANGLMTINMQEGEYFVCNIDEKFDLQLKKEAEGYVFDVFPTKRKYDDECLNSMTVWNEDLDEDEEGQ